MTISLMLVCGLELATVQVFLTERTYARTGKLVGLYMRDGLLVGWERGRGGEFSYDYVYLNRTFISYLCCSVYLSKCN